MLANMLDSDPSMARLRGEEIHITTEEHPMKTTTKTVYTISNTNGRTGGRWEREYETQEDAACALRAMREEAELVLFSQLAPDKMRSTRRCIADAVGGASRPSCGTA
jgi:hypothetical protein